MEGLLEIDNSTGEIILSCDQNEVNTIKQTR